jgi:hypothetical protein
MEERMLPVIPSNLVRIFKKALGYLQSITALTGNPRATLWGCKGILAHLSHNKEYEFIHGLENCENSVWNIHSP